MSVVQTGYPNRHGTLVEGQIVHPNDCAVDSLELTGATSVSFGRAVQPGVGGAGIQIGIGRPTAALVNGALGAAATALTYDAPAHGALQAGRHIVIDNEIIFVSEVASATAATIVRGALGSTAAAHSDDATIHYLTDILFRGIAIMDERVAASRGVQFQTNDIVPVLWRGDVAVRVNAAVAEGDQAVAAAATSGAAYSIGTFSSRSPGGNQVAIPGGRFVSSAASGALAVLRLDGHWQSNV